MTIKEMSCHVWALSANTDNAAALNTNYEAVCNAVLSKTRSRVPAEQKKAFRKDAMEGIAALAAPRTVLTDHDVYLCGGFGADDVCPKHMWLEDHTAGKTYDTMPDEDVQCIDEVGEEGKDFRPGCNADPFPAVDIVRVLLNGFTKEQVDSMP